MSKGFREAHRVPRCPPDEPRGPLHNEFGAFRSYRDQARIIPGLERGQIVLCMIICVVFYQVKTILKKGKSWICNSDPVSTISRLPLKKILLEILAEALD